MICFDQVVLVLLGDVAGGGQQLVEHTRVGGCSVGVTSVGDGPCCSAWVKNRRVAATSRFVDTSTSMTWPNWSNRPIQIDPSPRDFDIRFIDKPPVTRGVSAG
jgi:hypothetical protein